MITAIHTHSGQYHAYGDSYYEWDITTDANETREEIIEYCFTNLYKNRVPHYDEWVKEFRNPNGNHYYDYGYYFTGYFTLTPGYGDSKHYKFSVCKPYTD